MKKATKLKAFMLSLIMTALLLPMTSFAQSSDDFFRVGDEFNGNRDVLTYSLTGSLANDDFGAPLGSGLLILTAVGAGYAIARRKRSFRKGTALMLTALLLLGMTDCKKKIADPITPTDIKITLNVSGDNDGSKVEVNPPHVTFENGDKVLVGYNDVYIGTLTHNGENFSGTVTVGGDNTKPLYFYFVGNKDTGTLTEGTTTSCTVNISDQSTALPVLSFSASNENYNGGGTYTASLHNQCALVKFTMENPAGSVQVGSMHTEATISFATPGITPTATTGSVRLNSKSKTEKWAILLPQEAVTNATVTIGSENKTVDVPAITRNAYITDIPAIANTAVSYGDLSQVTADYEAQYGDILYGILGGNYKITIAPGATVTLNGATINGVNDGDKYKWAGLTCLGDATIILKDGTTNNVKGFHEDYPGIYVPAGSTLIIKGETSGTGILNASSNTDPSGSGAGIGGGWSMACGNIEIQGGVINATGSTCAAGIGSCNAGCGNITISGGTVTATGGASGAGIGSGSDNEGCGNITISGGTVTATGGDFSAGIGTGKQGRCGNITIESTVTCVTATKGGGSYSIGAGYNGYCGTVTVDPSLRDITVGDTRTISPVPSVPTGAIDGLFSVSSTKQVYFSQGNLQATYDGSSWSWAFATNQWDCILNNEGNTKITNTPPYVSGYSGSSTTVDLFCWVGASSAFEGVAQYGITSSSVMADYGTSKIEDLKSDWGNTIGSGWRTLTKDEWDYLLNTRTGATVPLTDIPQLSPYLNNRYRTAIINSDGTPVYGLILFPDGGVFSEEEATRWYYYDEYKIECTTAQWEALAAKGCVFLPSAWYRPNEYNAPTVVPGSSWYYWTSTSADMTDYEAYCVSLQGSDVIFGNTEVDGDRFKGKSVRLVKDAN